MKAPALKPCPSCGEEAPEAVPWVYRNEAYAFVRCPRCGIAVGCRQWIGGDTDERADPRDAIARAAAAWNRRAKGTQK